MSDPKEPKYYCTDFTFRNSIRDAQVYTALFSKANGRKTGDASPQYLYSEVAAQEIVKENPNAKFILSLRDPIEAARSWHTQNILSYNEDITDFEFAWNAQADRRAGTNVPVRCAEPKLLQYGSVYSYSAQLQRLFDLVDRSRCHVLIYEEFFANPRPHYARMLEFLGVPDDGRTRFPVINSARLPGNMLVHGLININPFFSRSVEAFVQRKAHSISFHPRNFLKMLNSVPTPKLRPEFRDELRRFFSADIAKTEALLARRLDVWGR